MQRENSCNVEKLPTITDSAITTSKENRGKIEKSLISVKMNDVMQKKPKNMNIYVNYSYFPFVDVVAILTKIELVLNMLAENMENLRFLEFVRRRYGMV